MKKIFCFASTLLMSTMMWAAVETYNFKSFTSSDKVELSANNFNVTLTKGTQTQPAWNDNNSEARLYPGSTLIISSTNNITKIVYTYTINANKKGKVPTIDGAEGSEEAGTWTESTKTWTGSDTEVTFSISGEAGNVGFTSVTVTTDGEGGGGGGGGDATEITYIMAEAYNYYDYLSEDGEDITLYLYNDPQSYEYTQLDLIVPNGTGLTGIPVGTYTIDETGASMTAMIGFQDEETYEVLGCWVFGEGEDDYWDLDSGTITVSKSGNNYTILAEAACSYDGTEFKISYTGEITVEEGEFEEAIPEVLEEQSKLNAVKTLENGHVMIIRNGEKFNIVGQRL